jgi:hypothetical protein
MRHLPSILVLLATACSIEAIQRPPPLDRFVHPVSVVYRSVPGSPQGVLYVANANFERCYDQGSIIAVDLAQVTGGDGATLPPLGTLSPGSGTPQLTNLNVAAGSQSLIQSFAGDLALWEPASERAPRLFVTTRSDAGLLNAIDLPQPLQLQPAQEVSLENVPGALNGQPRAPSPMGLAVAKNGELWVTHLDVADSPANSRQNFQSYAVRLDAESLQLSADQFFPLANPNLALGGAQGLAIGERYVFVGGRFLAGLTADVSTGDGRRFLVRLLDRRQPTLLSDPRLEITYSALDVRGLALDENVRESKGRLYVVARQPDTLLVVDVRDSTSSRPKLSVVAAVPLPDGPSQLALVRRARGSPLVAVSCGTAGAVVLYDPDVGQIVAQVGEVGLQPHGLAVQQSNDLRAARLFVTNFSDGRVAVIDIRDVSRPQEARLVAHLGARQDTDRTAGGCQEVPQ